MMTWTYNGQPFEPEALNHKEVYGFVYQITNLENDMKYIGKKYFWQKKTRQVKKKKKKYLAESDWRSYYGSNDTLKEEASVNPDNFNREILRICETKSECTYYEAKYQFENDVILRPDYYNGWIMARVTRKHMARFQITSDNED